MNEHENHGRRVEPIRPIARRPLARRADALGADRPITPQTVFPELTTRSTGAAEGTAARH